MDKIREQYRLREQANSKYPLMISTPKKKAKEPTKSPSQDFINQRFEQTLAPATRYAFSLYKPSDRK